MAIWTASDNTAINYELHGQRQGQTLLLLPGLLGALSQWQRFLPALAPHYRLLLVDLRGHGRSENRATALEPERMAADLGELLDYLGIETAHVAGYSLGGYLGLMLHLGQPRRVPTLLMHATKFYWNEEAISRMRRQLDPDAMAEKVPSYANQLALEHGANRWRNLVRQAGDLVARLANEGLTEGMAHRVQIPVLVSVGDRDEMIPLAEAQRLSRVFPHGRLLVLPGVQHPFASVPEVPLLPMMKAFHHEGAPPR
jgi:pimeloyl-ACP methyl ester carboxylesterase